MATVNRTPKEGMKECPSCHEMKPQSRFFTQDDDSVCRRCQIGLFHEEMQAMLQDTGVNRSYRSIPSHGYVYLFYSSLMGLYKIGKSINPHERKQGLSIPNVELVFTFYTQHMSVHENLMHHIYQPQRVGGEWFKLHDTHVAEIKYIGSRLGIVIDSLEGFDWQGMITEQEKIASAKRRVIRQVEKEEQLARHKAYKEYKARFRRRCPNCLRLFRLKGEHKFCSLLCHEHFKNSKRIQNTYLSDPDNIAIPMLAAWDEIFKYSYEETEIDAITRRCNATKRLRELKHIKATLRELANQAYDLMSKD